MNHSTKRVEPPSPPARGKKIPQGQKCAVSGCDKPVKCRGWCLHHYGKWSYHGDPEAVGQKHVKDKLCTAEGCERFQVAKGYCSKHWIRVQRWGDPLVKKRSNNGAGSISSTGYRIITVHGHPGANKNGLILEHRYIMGEIIGRPLERHESVHHLDGDKVNNAPENLELWVSTHPAGQRVEELVTFAREVIGKYGHLFPE